MRSFGLTANFPSVFLGVCITALSVPYTVEAVASSTINQLAQSFTVRITGQSPGSGVIIERDGATYTVLTAAHVVETEDDYEIVTPDSRRFPIVRDSIRRLPGLDLALLHFVTERPYAVADIGDSTVIQGGDPLFVAGFPIKSAAITETIFNFTEGQVTAVSNKAFLDGYGLIYTNKTLPGMSGGAVLNQDGQLVGIHGRADTTNEPQNQSLNEAIYIKTGFNLGISTNQFLVALQQLETSLKLKDPVSPSETSESQAFNLYLKGLNKLDKREFSEAVQLFSQTLELKFDFPEARLARAHAFIMASVLGNEDADRATGTAIRDCTRVIQQRRDQASGYYCRGNAYTYAGDYESARTDFDRAIELSPHNAMAYYRRGYGLMLSGNTNQAIADLTRAIDLNPQFEDALTIRGSLLKSTNPRQAIADYSRAIELNPNQIRYYLSRGEINLADQNYTQAIQDLSVFIQKKPKAHLPYAQRGLALIQNGQYKQALVDLNQSILLMPEPVKSVQGYSYALPYYGRGLAYFHLGQTLRAIQALQIAKRGLEAAMSDPPSQEYFEIVKLLKQLQS